MAMRFFSTVCVLSLITTAALAAPADQPGHKSPAPGSASETLSAVKDSTMGAIGMVSAQMTHSMAGFVTAAAASDMYEVEAGKIARSRAQSDAVRDLAGMMVKAHTATTASLKKILASNKLHVTPPAHLDDRRQNMIDDLRGAKAEDFDHRYLAQQEAAHKEAQILMRGYAQDGDNAAVKQFAAETLPKVEEHLSMVTELESKDGHVSLGEKAVSAMKTIKDKAQESLQRR